MPENAAHDYGVPARPDDWLGGVLAIEPVHFYIIRWLAIIIAIGVALALLFGSYQHKIMADGRLLSVTPFEVLRTPRDGSLQAIFVRPDDPVLAGDVLAAIKPPSIQTASSPGAQSYTHKIARLSAQHAELKKLVSLKITYLGELQKINAKIGLETKDQAEVLKRQIAQAQQIKSGFEASLERSAILLKRSAISQQQYEELGIKTLEAKRDVLALQLQLKTKDRELIQLREDLTQKSNLLTEEIINLNLQISDIESEISENQRASELKIQATRDGIVDFVAATPGDQLQAGELLIVVKPSQAKMRAMLAVTREQIAFIEEGMEVLIEVTAFPGREFGFISGVITSLSSTTLDHKLLPGMRKDQTENYLAIAEIDQQTFNARGRQWTIKQGMSVQAWIKAEKLTLWEWLLKPIYNAADRNPDFWENIRLAARHIFDRLPLP